MTLEQAVYSWITEEAGVRELARLVGGDLRELVDELYATIHLHEEHATASWGDKQDACVQLYKLTKAGLSTIDSCGPGPHLEADAWEWGAPGSIEDRELLE